MKILSLSLFPRLMSPINIHIAQFHIAGDIFGGCFLLKTHLFLSVGVGTPIGPLLEEFPPAPDTESKLQTRVVNLHY